ncbi:monovalent cation/H(+) antiporter subunit G [Acetobacteraceae bacterium KSS8]|uniref:Monovalent cation/H(+) antiporter subunit G n=1 Tax=Endosaccharibacter trunci TaxID=2812733 RepID=A0ABT1W730_9PROT|nr:monovalent cation/H(+) antiporter subunit G [Acetobacteraceae bacterium KSS8]
MAGAIAVLLCLAVICAAIGTLGFLRLRDTLDRMHCAVFVTTGVGFSLTLAAFLSDGASGRAIKMALITLFTLLGSAATSHVLGRAMVARGHVPEALPSAALSEPSDPRRGDERLG